MGSNSQPSDAATTASNFTAGASSIFSQVFDSELDLWSTIEPDPWSLEYNPSHSKLDNNSPSHSSYASKKQSLLQLKDNISPLSSEFHGPPPYQPFTSDLHASQVRVQSPKSDLAPHTLTSWETEQTKTTWPNASEAKPRIRGSRNVVDRRHRAAQVKDAGNKKLIGSTNSAEKPPVLSPLLIQALTDLYPQCNTVKDCMDSLVHDYYSQQDLQVRTSEINSGFPAPQDQADHVAAQSDPSTMVVSPGTFDFDSDSNYDNEIEEIEENVLSEGEMGLKPFSTAKPKPLFRCPFYQRNPHSYEGRSCSVLGWSSILRVKEHVYRCHVRRIDLEGISEEQVRELRSRKGVNGTSKNGIEKWRHMYRILFPMEPIPSPFFESRSSCCRHMLVKFKDRIISELPKRIDRDTEGRLPISLFKKATSRSMRINEHVVELFQSFMDTEPGLGTISRNEHAKENILTAPNRFSGSFPARRARRRMMVDVEQEDMDPKAHQRAPAALGIKRSEDSLFIDLPQLHLAEHDPAQLPKATTVSQAPAIRTKEEPTSITLSYYQESSISPHNEGSLLATAATSMLTGSKAQRALEKTSHLSAAFKTKVIDSYELESELETPDEEDEARQVHHQVEQGRERLCDNTQTSYKEEALGTCDITCQDRIGMEESKVATAELKTTITEDSTTETEEAYTEITSETDETMSSQEEADGIMLCHSMKKTFLRLVLQDLYGMNEHSTVASFTLNRESRPRDGENYSENSPGSCEPSPPTAQDTQSSKKRKRELDTSDNRKGSNHNDNPGGGREDEDDEEEKKKNSGSRPKTLDKEKLKQVKLACPFYKRNPLLCKTSRACRGPGWNSTHRIKEHLYRKHMQPLFCLRCNITFDDEAKLASHLRASIQCENSDGPRPQGITKLQLESLRSRKRNDSTQSQVMQWKKIYGIIFPDEDIPLPFYTPSDEKEFGMLYRFKEYLQQNLLGHLRGISSESSVTKAQIDKAIDRTLDSYLRGYSQTVLSTPSSIDMSENLSGVTSTSVPGSHSRDAECVTNKDITDQALNEFETLCDFPSSLDVLTSMMDPTNVTSNVNFTWPPWIPHAFGAQVADEEELGDFGSLDTSFGDGQAPATEYVIIRNAI